MTETFVSINQWQRETSPNATVAGVERHIAEEWSEFCSAAHLADRIEEATDMIILLLAYIDRAGEYGAQRAIDEKMRINRTRNWRIQSDGTGRHV